MEFRISISPDPLRIINKAQKRNYSMCTIKEQYNSIKKAILLTFENINIETKLYSELNNNALLHYYRILIITNERPKKSI